MASRTTKVIATDVVETNLTSVDKIKDKHREDRNADTTLLMIAKIEMVIKSSSALTTAIPATSTAGTTESREMSSPSPPLLLRSLCPTVLALAPRAVKWVRWSTSSR
jgi:hypothetical protein